MSSKTSSTFIHKVTANLRLGNQFLACSSVHLSASVNSVPFIVATIGGYVQKKDTTNVIALNPKSVIGLLEYIQGSIGKEEGSVNITLVKDSGKTDTVTLLNWVVVGSGVANNDSGGFGGVQVTLAHPSYYLQQGGLISYGFPEKEPELLAMYSREAMNARANNFMDVVSLAMDIWITEQMDLANRSSAAGDKTLEHIRKTRSLIHKVSEYVDTSKTPGLPTFVRGYGGNLVCGLLHGIRMSGVESVWSMIMGEILSQCGLSIVPTYDKKTLSLEPANVWMRDGGRTVLPYSNISSMSVNPTETSPVAGVVVSVSDIADIDVETWTITEAYGKDRGVGDYTYVIDKYSKESMYYGRVMRISPPWWITSVNAFKDVGHSTNVSNTRGFTQQIYPDQFDLRQEKVFMPIEDTLKALASSYLYLKDKQTTSASLVIPLTLMSSGSDTLYPGIRFGLENTDVSMYINQIDHVIDSNTKVALTRLTCNYVGSSASSEFMDKKIPFYEND